GARDSRVTRPHRIRRDTDTRSHRDQMTRSSWVAAAGLVMTCALGAHAGDQRPSSAPASRDRTGEISGAVRRDDGAPARQVLVMIAGTDVGLIRVTSTDASGRFVFSGLPAGHFLVGAGES